MKKSELIELLNDQVDALNAGRINAEIFDWRQHFEESVEIASLFQLAEDVKAALIPVPVPPFREQLRRQLENYEPANVTIRSSSVGRKQKVFFVAVAGSVLSAAGLFIVLLRRLRSTNADAAQPVSTTA